MPWRQNNTDVIAGLVGLVITAVFWVSREPWMPLSAQWPNAILTFMLLASLGLLLKGWISPMREPIFIEGSRPRMAVIAGLLLIWGLALPRLGFIASSIGFFFLIWWFIQRAVSQEAGERVPWASMIPALLVSSGLTLAFHAVFTRVLYVPLPKGTWWS